MKNFVISCCRFPVHVVTCDACVCVCVCAGEQVVSPSVDPRGGVRRARGAGHGGAVPRLRDARPAQYVLRDRHQR